MGIVTVTPKQAAMLADAVRAAQSAQQTAAHLLAVLVAGTDGEARTLADINVDTGVLTFAPLASGDRLQGDALPAVDDAG